MIVEIDNIKNNIPDKNNSNLNKEEIVKLIISSDEKGIHIMVKDDKEKEKLSLYVGNYKAKQLKNNNYSLYNKIDAVKSEFEHIINELKNDRR